MTVQFRNNIQMFRALARIFTAADRLNLGRYMDLKASQRIHPPSSRHKPVRRAGRGASMGSNSVYGYGIKSAGLKLGSPIPRGRGRAEQRQVRGYAFYLRP